MTTLPTASTAVTVTVTADPAVVEPGAVTTKWSSAPDASSPAVKSPKAVMPVACVLVAVRVPATSVDQLPLAYCSTTNPAVFAPGSTSPGTNVNVPA